jgi:hypothetical protein
VPGHGDNVGQGFVEEQAVALAALAELARRVHRGERSFDDALTNTPFPAYPAEDIRRPLQRALAQLKGDLA